MADIEKILKTISSRQDGVFIKEDNKIIFYFISKINGSLNVKQSLVFKNELEQFKDIEENIYYNTKAFINLGILERAISIRNIYRNKLLEAYKQNYDILVANIKASTLKEIEKFVHYEEVRCYLNGIYFDSERENIVATNGHILYCDKNDFINKKSFISNIPSFKEDCKIYVNEELKITKYEYELFNLYTRIIDYDYVNYFSVIPKKGGNIVDFTIIEKFLDKNFDKIIFEKDKTILYKKELKKEIDLSCEFNKILYGGFNIKYLINSLSCLKTRQGMFDGEVLYFKEKNKNILIMPIIN